MNNKFAFTGETKTIAGVEFKRIKALKAFGNVSEGETGGWIEKELNISAYGNAWVYGNARVSGNALVSGDAWEKSPLYIQGTAHAMCMYNRKKIKIGCQIHHIKTWLTKGEEIAKANDYTPEQIEEYRLYVELAAKIYGVN